MICYACMAYSANGTNRILIGTHACFGRYVYFSHQSRIKGVGGHAAFPHLVVDPIVAASAVVMNMQTLVSRGMNPLQSGVVSVSQFEAGDGAFNVIPAIAVLCGTIQALSNESLLQLQEGLLRIARSTAKAHGCKLAESTFSKDHFPMTMNGGELSPFAKRATEWLQRMKR
jgi:metal-dependent amidase/aminoacylase/carboxypeptidase family protein